MTTNDARQRYNADYARWRTGWRGFAYAIFILASFVLGELWAAFEWIGMRPYISLTALVIYGILSGEIAYHPGS